MGGVGPRIEVPTCCVIFLAEICQSSRAWAQRQFRIVRWTEHDSGGHFAAMEEPQAFVADIRAAFRAVRAVSAVGAVRAVRAERGPEPTAGRIT